MPERLSELWLAIDTVWVVVAAALVLFMQVGFALLEIGFTGAQNAGNVIMKKLVGLAITALAFFAAGFAIAFGGGTRLFGDHGWFLRGDPFRSLAFSRTPVEAKFLFEMAVAAVAVSIVSGAMAGRTRFKAYLFVTLGVAVVIYPVVAHWVWADGWLRSIGFLDFAGSTVVHTVGGFTALVGAVMLGARLRPADESRSQRHQHVPHHQAIVLPALGVLVLWVGWYGFNSGSTLAAVPAIGRIALTTTLAAAAGGLAAMLTIWLVSGRPEVSMSANGVLAGLVAITAPCAYVEPWAAIVIGGVAGTVLVGSVQLLDRRIDDPAGAVSVHGTCGVVGTLMAGLLASPRLVAAEGIGRPGLLYGGGLRQLGVQAIGSLSAVAWILISATVLLWLLKATVGLRVSRSEELLGLDVSQHGDVDTSRGGQADAAWELAHAAGGPPPPPRVSVFDTPAARRAGRAPPRQEPGRPGAPDRSWHAGSPAPRPRLGPPPPGWRLPREDEPPDQPPDQEAWRQ